MAEKEPFRTWESPQGEALLGLVDMEEERYLRTVASYLRHAKVPVGVQSPHHGHSSWTLQFREYPGGPYVEFYVSSGGVESDFTLQICDPGPDGKWDTFIDVPWGRPVTAAYKILDHYNQTVRGDRS